MQELFNGFVEAFRLIFSLDPALMEIVWRVMPSYVVPEHLNLASVAGAALVVAGSCVAALVSGKRPSEGVR